jgi:eukaryotic-like serine/threonine-protein kinase
MITPAGVIKVLDFGLAAVAQSSDPSNPANSPTLTISTTRAGMILGTAGYMSPEQARGKVLDKRTDIWAFGVVLCEMLTGKQMFAGETVSDTLAQVLTKEPDWQQVPARVRRLLEACLQRDPKQRLQAIGDWRLLLADAQPQGIAPSQSQLGWILFCSAENFASGAWGDDGNIIAALRTQGGLSRVSSAGGTPAAVTELAEGETMHRWPQVLPGSDAVLFTAYTGGPKDANIDALSFKTHQRKTLVSGGEMARYVAAPNGQGYPVYLHQSALLAVAFDPGNLAISGTAQPILDDVRAMGQTYRGDFDVSRNGTLVYLGGSGEPERWIFWLDPSGKTEPLHSTPGLYNGWQFSPDGKRLVFGMGDVLTTEDLWVQDLERNTSVRLTSLGGTSTSPLWSPDSAYILFAHLPNAGIYRVRADGSGEPQRLAKVEGTTFLSSISPDGKRVAFATGNPFTAMQVSTAPLEGTADHPLLGKAEPFLRASGFPMPAFSPDGRWLAYASGETGTTEIYVQPYPGPGAKVVVSTGGGGFPVWSPNRHQLFFIARRVIMVADYTATGDSFTPGTPRQWSPHPILPNYGGGPFQPYALAPDGKRFAVMLYPDGTTERHAPLHLTFLLNFADELRRRVATGN